MSEPIHDLRAEIFAALNSSNLGRSGQLRALEQCRAQLENRTLVESALLISGYEGADFSWSDQLEIYLDIQRNGEEIGFISKGWTDPGFRVADVVIIEAEGIEGFSARAEDVHDLCSTNGFACTVTLTPDRCEVLIECVIYSTGFDGRTLSQSLSALAKCSRAAIG